MYTFSSKLKTLSIVLMILGILGIGYGFLNAPKNTADVEKILKDEEAHHGGGHHEAAAESTHEMPKVLSAEEHHAAAQHEEATHEVAEAAKDTASVKLLDTISVDSTKVAVAPVEEEHHAEAKTAHAEEHHLTAAEEKAHHEEHVNHVLHQLQNKPWSALYVACIFVMLISLGALAFYAIQQVAQAGWSPVLFRVMQGITAYLPVGSVIFFVLLVLCGLHYNHIFVWMADGVTEKGHENYDKLVAAKSGYLNFPFWIIRAAIFLIGWNLYRYFSRKNCLAQDESSDNSFYKKNFNISAMFLVFFIVTESIMSWDWIMSVDPHWFSTLFGWYVFASFFVSGITTIALVTLYLKSKGYLEHVNNSHIHDLAKFMFGISVFWTYLWFSQFMLIWYADIPEEVTYFWTRIELYNLPFFGAVVMNFVFPILILINSDFKRLTWIVVMAGIVILFGHYVDFFNMIMPGTVGDRWFIGIPEIGSLCFFIGLFLLVVFTALTKAPLLPKRNPFIEESKHFHY
ncbi:cation-translocating P-type ATPase [Flavobacterium pallidum]|uniref:Quinol:cytochrome C oxidoreductase n=1 Tax=Flavobacterium pallidum TaxID=2172098 RepID=A0A2S1SG42_9FLAO|nr:quinol:cytochrome C oxidoreductase [Flavobacterium pallidum]AWI25384.1 quinol:cytochrome C oxidoreductase [Flavobacterium pallidum]